MAPYVHAFLTRYIVLPACEHASNNEQSSLISERRRYTHVCSRARVYTTNTRAHTYTPTQTDSYFPGALVLFRAAGRWEGRGKERFRAWCCRQEENPDLDDVVLLDGLVRAARAAFSEGLKDGETHRRPNAEGENPARPTGDVFYFFHSDFFLDRACVRARSRTKIIGRAAIATATRVVARTRAFETAVRNS